MNAGELGHDEGDNHKEARPSRGGTTPFLHFFADGLSWAIILPMVTALRYDFNLSRSFSGGILSGVAVVCVAQGVIGWVIGLYRGQWMYGTFEETLGLASSVLLAGAGLEVWSLIVGPSNIPRSVPAMATIAACTATIAIRSIRRLLHQQKSRPASGSPLVVVGAGDAAVQVIRLLLSTPSSPYLPVALVDDDPRKRGLRIQGVRVQGSIADLPKLLSQYESRHVLVAAPSADAQLVQMVSRLIDDAETQLLVLPPVQDIFGGVTLGDIRPVTPEDFLGRATVQIDEQISARFIEGKRVLVTGAGGSIGSELCRQIVLLGPDQLIMLDRDEGGLHATQLLVDGHGLLDSPNIVLADIRDETRLTEVFEMFRPEVVFHAAALKHLPLLEQHPLEGWKTNVVGTHNVLVAAEGVGVERFVNISTDKAADPVSVLGVTKRLTERLTAEFAMRTQRDWVSVRFGNVLGSRGSVLTSFHAQVRMGGPLTVTHPDVTRYFMTVAEAVRLTIFASAIGSSGEVLVLDMGTPVRILDVAQRYASMANPPLEIVFTGLRPGEKLHEVLFGEGEVDERPIHPAVTHVPVPPIRIDDVTPEQAVATNNSIFR